MPKERKNRDLEQEIYKLLEQNKNNYFNTKEISQNISARKHEYKEVGEILNKLKREGKISLRHRKFGIKESGQKETLTGTFDATSLMRGYSFAFVKSDKDDVFIDYEDTLTALHGDTVEVAIKYRRKGMLYGVVREIKNRIFQNVTGNLEGHKGKYYLVPDIRKIHVYININQLNKAKPGDKVVVDVKNWGDRQKNIRPSGNVIQVLGKAGDTAVEEISIIKQFDLPIDFPEAIMSEATAISEEISDHEISRRQDLRNVLTFTIDPASAKDYDDAISLVKSEGGFVLYVHIADVSHYVKPGTNLFEEAFSRGNSYYFPRRVIPMLPERISNKICSLRPEEDKLTMTVETHFDNEMNIGSQNVYESVICSDFRLNYEQVDELYEKNENDFIPPEISSVLMELRSISDFLSQQRYDKGYIPFNLPDLEFVFDDEGELENMKKNEETESHKLIENCMLLANEFVAKKLARASGKGMYRVHEEPDEDAFEKMLKLLNYYRLKHKKNKKKQKTIQGLLKAMPNRDYHRVFDFIILRSMKKARYDTTPIGHFGLATKNYTHFTSPIRRLSDLMVHHLIRKNVFKQKSKFEFKHDLQEFADQASEREIVADSAERETEFLYKRMFMKDKVGEEYTGVIVNLNKNLITVELDQIPISGIIPISTLPKDNYQFYSLYMELTGKRSGNVFRLTEKLRFRVEKVGYDLELSFLEKLK